MIMYSNETLKRVRVVKRHISGSYYYDIENGAHLLDWATVIAFYSKSRNEARQRLLQNLHKKLQGKLAEASELNSKILMLSIEK